MSYARLAVLAVGVTMATAAFPQPKPAFIKIPPNPRVVSFPAVKAPTRPPAAPLRQVKPQLVPLDRKTMAGLTRILERGEIDIRELPRYFDSPAQLAGALQTAVALGIARDALANAKSKAARQQVLGNAVKAINQSGLKASEAQVRGWMAALPPRFAPFSIAKRKNVKSKFTVSEATYFTRADLLEHGEINWGALGEILMCQQPLVEAGFTPGVSGSFGWTWTFSYPCDVDWELDFWNTSVDYCDYDVTFQVSFALGCDLGVQINCCGASAWGECAAETCLSIPGVNACAGCGGGVAVAAGGLTTGGDGMVCSYGLPLVVSFSCQFAGETLFEAQENLSPYTATGPCAPEGACH